MASIPSGGTVRRHLPPREKHKPAREYVSGCDDLRLLPTVRPTPSGDDHPVSAECNDQVTSSRPDPTLGGDPVFSLATGRPDRGVVECRCGDSSSSYSLLRFSCRYRLRRDRVGGDQAVASQNRMRMRFLFSATSIPATGGITPT